MGETVIKVENLSKSYLIGHQKQERYTALRDVLANTAKGFVKNASDLIRGKQLMGNDDVEEFFALKDINFEIKQGDRVGIIGRNGAGKSTLLKILSRITEPTTGKITLNGRVASLLEVGTGFHPELTGRENIYLNGAILGMSRNDIKRKFDEIVEFAEVEKFLDTPVKRYSSGMYVRLAFAVAAHLEPEILIVDEVLAVGDAEFQKKCLGKMEDVSKNEGRTVLFVSHNLESMQRLCNIGILLNNGQLASLNEISQVVNNYLNIAQHNQNSIWVRDKTTPIENHYFSKIEIRNSKNEGTNNICFLEKFKIRVYLTSKIFSENLMIGIKVTNSQNVPILTTSMKDSEFKNNSLKEGENIIEIDVNPNIFLSGVYYLTVACFIPRLKLFDIVENLVSFNVLLNDEVDKDPDRKEVVRPIYKWNINGN